MAVVDLAHLRRQPRLDVHAVGDVADGHLLLADAREERAHIARDTWPCSDDTALARRDSLSASTVMQNSLVADPAGSTRPRPMKLIAVEAERLAQRPEVLVDQLRRRSDRARRAPACGS